MRFLAALTIIFSLFMAAPVSAGNTHIIKMAPGGILVEFIARYWDWYKNGDYVRIEGECASACTIMLGIIPKDHICATKNAEFGFHTASLGLRGPFSEDGSRMLWFFYEGKVLRTLTKMGLRPTKPHPDILWIDAQEFVAPCPPASEIPSPFADPPKSEDDQK